MKNQNATQFNPTIYVVGTDEAGYGPNLGPLVVGASCWRVETVRSRADSNVDSTAPRSLKKRFPLFDFPIEKEASNAPQTTSSNVLEDVGSPFETAGAGVERLNAALAEISNRRGIFPLVDSKKLYGASKSLDALERSFWPAVLLANGDFNDAETDASATSRKALEIFEKATFRSALRLVAREDDDASPIWEAGTDFSLPLDAKIGGASWALETLERIRATFATTGIALLDVAARRVHPREFNDALDALELKSSLIAEVTTSLAVEVAARAASRAVEKRPFFVVLCDKLGGRDRYAPLLKARFPGAKIETRLESRAASVYRFAARRGVARNGQFVEFPTEIDFETRFTAKGESNVPTALASIVAKYFRELSMKPFNEFWRRALAPLELRPTAGYPLDAKRFRAEVDEARRRLEIDDQTFWRKK